MNRQISLRKLVVLLSPLRSPSLPPPLTGTSSHNVTFFNNDDYARKKHGEQNIANDRFFVISTLTYDLSYAKIG